MAKNIFGEEEKTAPAAAQKAFIKGSKKGEVISNGNVTRESVEGGGGPAPASNWGYVPDSIRR